MSNPNPNPNPNPNLNPNPNPNEVRNFKDLSHFETFYVVKIHNAFQVRLRARVRA